MKIVLAGRTGLDGCGGEGVASRVEVFDTTVPANTPIATPVVVGMRFDIGVVDRVQITVPPGPSGLVGFGILFSGVSVWPREDSRWIITDDEHVEWENHLDYTAGVWGVRLYNLDVFDHTLHWRWLVHEVVASLAPVTLQPIG